ERDRAEATRLEQVRVAAERVDLMRHAGELRERAAQLRRRAERLAAELSGATAEAAGIDALRASLVQARDVAQPRPGALPGARRSSTSGRIRWGPPRFFRSSTSPRRPGRSRTRTTRAGWRATWARRA